jgi:hypothetical protein
MSITKQLITEIEATAETLGIAPSTVGRRVGQGGHFYKRLQEGKRVWPDTADSVLDKLEAMKRQKEAG